MKTQTYLSIFYQINEDVKKIIEPLSLLTVRVYLFNAFFLAGLTKIRDWESTLFLFEYEYAVPFLPPHFAAYLGTAAELILPLLLLVGFLTSASAIGLFIFNIVAVLSLAEMPHAAFLLHVIWGILIFSLIIWGAGIASLDSLIKHKLSQKSMLAF